MATKPTEDEFVAGAILHYVGFDGLAYTAQRLRDRSGIGYMEFCDATGKVLSRPVMSETDVRNFHMNHELPRPE